jgi:CubicO group peptidase (beta-lactamase class C family)
MDAALLDDMFTAIDQRGIEVHSVLVVRNGYLVAERYTPPYQEGTRHELFSVTKSVVATLVGIALEERRIAGVEAPLAELLPERDLLRSDSQKAAITLEDLLTMRAGLAWTEGNPAYAAMYRSSDWVNSVLNLPMAEEPGSRFNYCSGCSHLLAASVQNATGRPLLDYAEEKLFGPIGIRQVAWDTDASGMPIGGWGLQLTPREMAKLGYLYLHDGSWEGRQVVPADWVRASVARHTATDSELGYGYQWWVYPRHSAYLARGRGGQLVVVLPDRALVVVFTADIDDDKLLFELIEEFIVPAAPVIS